MNEIKPALTPEEWAEFPSWGHSPEPEPGEEPLYHRTRHGIAAANLHEQPFGFTRLDVMRHREQEDFRRRLEVEDPLYANAHKEYADWNKSMADRIGALQPPEKT